MTVLFEETPALKARKLRRCITHNKFYGVAAFGCKVCIAEAAVRFCKRGLHKVAESARRCPECDRAWKAARRAANNK